MIALPSYQMGKQNHWTTIHLIEKTTLEVGSHRRLMWVDRLVMEYEQYPEVGYWRWTSITAHGAFSDGTGSVVTWVKDSTDFPLWVAALVHGHYPEFRKVRS